MLSRSPESARVNLMSMPFSGKSADFTAVTSMIEDTVVARRKWEREMKERDTLDQKNSRLGS